jgi:hypothetical protein
MTFHFCDLAMDFSPVLFMSIFIFFFFFASASLKWSEHLILNCEKKIIHFPWAVIKKIKRNLWGIFELFNWKFISFPLAVGLQIKRCLMFLKNLLCNVFLNTLFQFLTICQEKSLQWFVRKKCFWKKLKNYALFTFLWKNFHNFHYFIIKLF